jgi:hypothetical protein
MIMTSEFAVLLAGTGAVLLLAAGATARRRHVGRPAPVRGILVAVGVLADWWLFDAAFAHQFGPQRWLLVPLILVNVLLAFGAIYGGTGLRMHDDGSTLGGGTMGMLLGRDASLRANGYDHDLRR